MNPVGLKKALATGAFFILWLSAVAAHAETAFVRHVLDGDSLVLSDNRQVRLIGINAPEFGKDGAPNQPWAVAARDRLAQLVARRSVRLHLGREHTDRYGRLLAHVDTAEGTDVSEVLVREGLAWAIAIPPNLGRLEQHLRAEAQARAARLGVWSEPAYAPQAAASVEARDTGFRIIEGQVLRVGQGRHTIYFDLAPHLSLAIPREAWTRYFHGRPADWLGRRVTARGWISRHGERLRLRVAHPAMLTW